MKPKDVLLAGIRIVATFAFAEGGELDAETVNMRADFPTMAAFMAGAEGEIRAAWDKLAADPSYRGDEPAPCPA